MVLQARATLNLAALAFVGVFTLGIWQFRSIEHQIAQSEFQDLLKRLAVLQKNTNTRTNTRTEKRLQELAAQVIAAQKDLWAEQEDKELAAYRELREQLGHLATRHAAEIEASSIPERNANDGLMQALSSIRLLGRQKLPPKQRGGGCPPILFMRPFRQREDLGMELQRLNLRGIGVQVGVGSGDIARDVLSTWQHANRYVMVDLWEGEKGEADMARAKGLADDAQQRGWAREVTLRSKHSRACATEFNESSLDFVYLDARHDRKGLLEDLAAYWPKLKSGGVMAGHDYMDQSDVALGYDGKPKNDGIGTTGSSPWQDVKGAVDDFFSGNAKESPSEFKRCPRQVWASYANGYLSHQTWVVGK